MRNRAKLYYKIVNKHLKTVPFGSALYFELLAIKKKIQSQII